MGQLKKYRQILHQYLIHRASLKLATSPNAKPHLIIDQEKDEYIFLWIGWSEAKYKHSLMFHFQIIDGKIWIHENRTDIDLIKVFLEKGVAKSDIVLGFVAPYLRETGKMAA